MIDSSSGYSSVAGRQQRQEIACERSILTEQASILEALEIR